MASVNGHVVDKWAAIAGRWQFTPTDARYGGPGGTRTRHPVGLAKASPRFRDGIIECRIKLSRIERTSAGLFFGFQSEDSPYMAAVIGAFGSAYSAVEFRPGSGWFSVASAGLLSNLSPDVSYHLRVTVTGQSIRMTVDDVEVLSSVAPSPLQGTGFGLYTWDDAEVVFADVRISSSAPRLFVIMPFSEPYDTLYREVIHPVASNLQFKVVRVDEIPGPGIILQDIQRQIEDSEAVVAEISTQNPNVFYELGYAHALRKPAILLVRGEEVKTMPFDVRSYRAIVYDDSIGGKKRVERNLEQHLKAILGG